MDTSNSAPVVDMNFRVSELRGQMPGESDLAIRANETIKALVKELCPVLKFVTTTQRFSASFALSVDERACEKLITSNCALVVDSADFSLYIQSNGDFQRTCRCTKGSEDHRHLVGYPDYCAWQVFNFADVLQGVQNLLAVAKKKHGSHVDMIDTRMKKLDEIMAVLKK